MKSKMVLAWLILLVFVFSGISFAAPKKSTTVTTPITTTPATVATPTPMAPVAPAAPAVKADAVSTASAPAAQAVSQSDLTSYKNDVNNSLATLKQQIDKVSADNNDAKVGGQIFFRWQNYMANPGSNVNNFDVERAYIDVKKKLSNNASGRITLDVARLNNDSRRNLFDYLKYAYVEMPINIPAMLKPFQYDMTGKVGLQQTVWIDYSDKITGLRWIAKSFVDNSSIMSSADFGLGAAGKIQLPMVPEIEYQVTALNGSGYATTEGNGAKNLDLRLNTCLYKDKTLGEVLLGIYSNNIGLLDSGLTASSSRVGGTLALKNSWSTVYGELASGTSISGYSAGGWVGCPTYPFRAFARTDFFDPNINSANNEVENFYYGLIYDYSNDVKFSADVQNITGGSSASTSAGTTTSVFYLHTLVNL